MIIKKNKGFSLVELMIVLVVMGIIVSFAYPSYTNQVRKSKRADAHVALNEVVQRLESYFMRHYEYPTGAKGDASYSQLLTGLGYPSTGIISSEGHYEIEIDSKKTIYTVTAKPVAASSQQQDKLCFIMEIKHTGQRSAKNDSQVNTTNECWP